MNKTSIEWTDFTWNPIRARMGPRGRPGWFCTRISPGCKNCYASVLNRRFGTGNKYEVPMLAEHEFYLDLKALEAPLHRRKPAKIFVGDMFDLFHEAIPENFCLDVFRTMKLANQHTYQILTKRAARMQQFVSRLGQEDGVLFLDHLMGGMLPHLDHIWLGTSVENQQYADERIPLLLKTPAAVRFLSVEPMLEEICIDRVPNSSYDRRITQNEPPFLHPLKSGISWVICGGESGPGARPFNLAWAESLLKECRAAGVPFFMKQIGSQPLGPAHLIPYIPSKDRKGGDMTDWPEALRVREWPRSATDRAAQAAMLPTCGQLSTAE